MDKRLEEIIDEIEIGQYQRAEVLFNTIVAAARREATIAALEALTCRFKMADYDGKECIVRGGSAAFYCERCRALAEARKGGE